MRRNLLSKCIELPQRGDEAGGVHCWMNSKVSFSASEIDIPKSRTRCISPHWPCVF